MKPHHEGMRGSTTADPGLGSRFNPNPKLGLQVLVNPTPTPTPASKEEEEEEPTRNRFMTAFCEENKMRRKNVSKKKKPHEIALWGFFAKKENESKK